ncbi:MAG: hypothetical protein A2W99_00165 [Bacteroidetes bacterium GWF2_33_16]|nr:MAG: hypothetical protein A2X00_02870 [Bacteroidetes bacterium GWE2_32_14]OFY08689.1 MAG: hypothetical protein A2W99_00165 [Bacteroidetes bacterium GWF2_33_16]
MSTENKQNNEEHESMLNPRNLIALIITAFVILATMLIAHYSLYRAKEPDLSFVGQSLLPLWGTWIGTIIAFYFGRENFEAANRSYRDVIKTLTPEQKIAAIPVKEVMIPLEKIKYIEFKEDTKNEKIIDIIKNPIFKEYHRIAFLTPEKVFRYMIHKSTLALFLIEKTQVAGTGGSQAKVDTNTLTLQDLFQYDNHDSRIPQMLNRGYSFMSVSGCLLDAKNIVDSIPECQDVFVTLNGKETEPVLGLVTNNMILEKAKA